jgi:hypothetical protein
LLDTGQFWKLRPQFAAQLDLSTPAQPLGFAKKNSAQEIFNSLAPRLLYRRCIKANEGASDETITRNHV